MKNIILCADDYGQNTSISQAIIDLIGKKRLSATSCLTTSNAWLEHAQWLKPFINQVDIGLHFNLTEGSSLTQNCQFFPLFKLLMKALLRQIKQNIIEAELNAQLDRFEAGLGRLPDFIDGHQHVHQFPVIRDAVLNVYEKRLRPMGSYIRCTHDPKILQRWFQRNGLKKLIIELSGAYPFHKELIKRNIPHNQSFEGIYQFGNVNDYNQYFLEFLSKVSNNGLIMCHPGFENTKNDDEIAASRYQEYQYFLSNGFAKACVSQNVMLGKFYTK